MKTSSYILFKSSSFFCANSSSVSAPMSCSRASCSSFLRLSAADVAAGCNAGTVTALVLSGETTPEMLAASPLQPDYVFADVGALARAL